MIQQVIAMIGLCLLVAFGAGTVIGLLFKHIFWPSPTRVVPAETGKLESDLSAARKECVECLKTREGLEARIRGLETELEKRRDASTAAASATLDAAASPVSAGATALGQVTTVRARAAAAAAVEPVKETAEGAGEALGVFAEYDNLEEIFGIGPKLSTLLHGLGITRFKQIAQWTDIDIDRVDAHLAEFQGRIRRENWVQSARECHFKKYGEWL